MPCLQQNNTTLFPHCATFYNCGLTFIDSAPRGAIKRVSIIDKTQILPSGSVTASKTSNIVTSSGDFFDSSMVNNSIQFSGGSPTFNIVAVLDKRNIDVGDTAVVVTSQSFTIIGQHNQPASAIGPDDYCSEIAYNEVDFCHVHSFLDYSRRHGCCGSIPFFFGLHGCSKARFPIPTDEGLPPGLPKLPLGNHYPQTSTDRKFGRAEIGIWAKQRGGIYIAPWIQSTETVVVVWDGIKRAWGDSDIIDDDPLLSEAVREYVMWKHEEDFNKDYEAGASAHAEYEGPTGAKPRLIHQCTEETRSRSCEPSHARSATITSLFYNDEQSATATCPDGTTGSATTARIPAGTVASSISKADANQKAKTQAQTQAQQMLNCTGTVEQFTNDAQSATVSCQGEEGAPPPDGSPVTKTVPAGSVTSTISKADASQQALALAQQEAAAALVCTFWNRAKSYTATCPQGQSGSPVTKQVAAHVFSSNVSQSDADQQALSSVTNQANAALSCSGGGGGFSNTPQSASKSGQCQVFQSGHPVFGSVVVTIKAGAFTSTISQADANQQALNYANQLATQYFPSSCAQGGLPLNIAWPP